MRINEFPEVSELGEIKSRKSASKKISLRFYQVIGDFTLKFSRLHARNKFDLVYNLKNPQLFISLLFFIRNLIHQIIE